MGVVCYRNKIIAKRYTMKTLFLSVLVTSLVSRVDKPLNAISILTVCLQVLCRICTSLAYAWKRKVGGLLYGWRETDVSYSW